MTVVDGKKYRLCMVNIVFMTWEEMCLRRLVINDDLKVLPPSSSFSELALFKLSCTCLCSLDNFLIIVTIENSGNGRMA